MWIGLDYGTTNSAAAVLDGDRVRLFRLDPAGPDPSLMRSVLYIRRDQSILAGREAVEAYYRENAGRPRRLARQRVGEIEMTLVDVGSVKGYPADLTTYVEDVYVLVDELTPGRLLRSLKSGLATGYEGTTIFGRYYDLEALVAAFLRAIRERVEAESGRAVEGVVLGRPVHFVDSADEADDARAEDRLRQAAAAAGLNQVRFELEPVAAARHYERSAGRSGNVVVVDLGGGTVDVTVMRLGRSDQRRVYATGGVGVAGDSFDRRLVEGVLLDHLGRGSTWGPEGRPFPSQYSEALLNQYALLALHKPETLRFLQNVQRNSSRPRAIRTLIALLVNNDAPRLYDEVERAKIALSDRPFDAIRLSGDDIDLWQPVGRAQFESLIASELERIERCLVETLDRAGLEAGEIDAVVRTGGSAQMPCIVALLGRLFGPQKVVLSDVFGSVAAGLAIQAAESLKGTQ